MSEIEIETAVGNIRFTGWAGSERVSVIASSVAVPGAVTIPYEARLKLAVAILGEPDPSTIERCAAEIWNRKRERPGTEAARWDGGLPENVRRARCGEIRAVLEAPRTVSLDGSTTEQ